ncbi:methyltransferase domain-containing protein [Amycolatopsis sp. K13G38]|uniref:Methyltransferase domain-containing protein n=1 Tax=Amycolatopsis acididurans TaxID=2724524 RepID=A0ABX1J9G3_9PSEU|nr:methyltransferase domain-containing protein [Amycolatopsis acididurans]NKQ56432.1 methyltransferase domain-containing protein [Amycolatopsis acididurans]
MTSTVSWPPSVLAAVRCSVCGEPVELAARTLRCDSGHAFDLAKQGYVNLLHAKVAAGTADTAEMVAARADFLAAGHYRGLVDLVAAQVATFTRSGLIVDAGAGTGHYLAHVLDRLPDACGLALDVSAMALRRAARAHSRIAAAVWNLWERWPVGDEVASVVLNVFAPRNAAEFHRVLRPGGHLIVASPGPAHLRELASVVDLLDVDERKQERLSGTLSGHFSLVDRHEHTEPLTLAPEDVRRAVLMGPNAHHPERLTRLSRVDRPMDVTASFVVGVYRRVS